MSIILIVLPIFALIAFGYGLSYFEIVSRQNIHTLNNFVYYVSLPAIILLSFWNINWFDVGVRTGLLTNTLSIFAFAGILFIFLRFLPFSAKTKAGIFVASLVGNTVYMGFPIGERALGAGSYDVFLAAATPHLAIGIAISVFAIERFILRSHSSTRYLKDFLLNPLILALIAGIALSLAQAHGKLATLLQQPISMLAATASPIALVTLGAFLRGVFQFKFIGFATIAVILKLVALPFLIYGIGRISQLDSHIIIASVLAAAMPTAVTSFVIAEKYDAAPQLVATILFLSTIFSLGTITLALFFLL